MNAKKKSIFNSFHDPFIPQAKSKIWKGIRKYMSKMKKKTKEEIKEKQNQERQRT